MCSRFPCRLRGRESKQTHCCEEGAVNLSSMSRAFTATSAAPMLCWTCSALGMLRIGPWLALIFAVTRFTLARCLPLGRDARESLDMGLLA